MTIYDISQEVFSCDVFPGDPSPRKEQIMSTEKGDVCNLTAISMCAHNGTHIDAPYHFFGNGKTVDQLDLSKLIGYSYVAEQNGIITAEGASGIIEKAKKINEEAARRILIKGKATVSDEAAVTFAENGIYLLGNESQTVGDENAPMKAHLSLLSKEVVLLEGIRLSNVTEGVYLLNAAPVNLGGCDGAPSRAILIKL